MPGIFHWWPLYFWVVAVVVAAYSFVRARNSVAMTYTGRDGGGSWSIAYVAVMVAAAVTAASVLSSRGSSNHHTARPTAASRAVHKTVKPKAAAGPKTVTKAKARPKKQPAKPAARTISFVRLYPVHDGCGGIAFRPKPSYTGGHYQYKKGTVVRLTPKPCKGWQFARWSAPAKGLMAVRCKHRTCRFAIRRVRRAHAVFIKRPVVHVAAPSPVVVAAPQPVAPARPVYSAPATPSYTPAPSPDPAPPVKSTRPKPDPYPAKPKKKVPQKPVEVLLPPPPPAP